MASSVHEHMNTFFEERDENSIILQAIDSGTNVITLSNIPTSLERFGECSRGVMVKAMDCGIVVSEFVLQSRYCVHFPPYTLEKGMNFLILPAMG